MSEEDKFSQAEAMIVVGHKEEAAKMFLDIFNSSSNVVMRLNCGLELNRSLDPVRDTEQLLVITNETIRLSNRLVDKDIKAIALCYKGLLSLHKKLRSIDRMKRIKLSPEWFEFSLEREQVEYETLEQELSDLEENATQSLKEAEGIADKTKDSALMSTVYSMIGQAYGYRSMELRYNKIGKNGLQHWLIEKRLEHLLYNRKDKKGLKLLHKEADKFFLKAISISEENNDLPEKALALYNYANQLRTMYRYREARKYLNLSKEIAIKIPDKQLLENIDTMDDRIKTKKVPEMKF
ncbi:MAG: hypothetical protein WC536_01040 [Patescibacteria group bacterium]